MSRFRTLAREARDLYAGIFHVYRAWWAEIIVLSMIIFVPLGLLDAADSQALSSLGPGHDVKFIALAAGALLVTATSVLGEVFLAGAIGLSLTHAEDGRPPSLSFIARHLMFRRLIAIDISYVLIIATGFVLLVIPGIAAMIYLALAGPIAEVEDKRVGASFQRSFQLVRGNFWLVFWIVFPIEVIGGAIETQIESLLHFLIGESFIVLGLAEALANVLISPMFALASVLLARRLVAIKEGREMPGAGPRDLRPASRLRPD